jgi:hypothetical protein
MEKRLINSLKEELNRIKINMKSIQLKNDFYILKIKIISDNSDYSLNEIKKILCLVIESILKYAKWPNDDEFLKILPDYFINKFGPEMTENEKQEWLIKWNSLNLNEKIEEKKNIKWTLSNWLFWINPEERSWKWFYSKIIDKNNFIIEIISDEDSFPYGALEWLIKTSGGKIIEIVE